MKKRIFCLVLALIMFALGVIPVYAIAANAANPVSHSKACYAINKYGINLRDEQGKTIVYIPAWNVVYIHEVYSKDASKSVIEWNGKRGIALNGGLILPHRKNSFKATNKYVVNLRDDNNNLIATIPPGEHLEVFGVYLKDLTYSVVMWNGKRGRVLNGGLKSETSAGPQKPIEPTKPQPEKSETLANFSYTKNEYDAKVVDYALALTNTKGVEIAELPVGTKVHVYGPWTKNPKRAVVSCNGEYGTVWIKHLERVTNKTVSYTPKAFEAVTTTQVNVRDDNYTHLGYIKKGEKINVLGISNKRPDRAVVKWGKDLATVSLSYIIPCKGEGYWAVISKWDLDIWNQADKDFSDVPRYSLVWVYGNYDKNSVKRVVVNCYGTIGTVRSDGISKVINGVFVSISHQKVTLIRNGKLVAQGNCVTGLKGKYDTRIGSFNIKYKDTDATLTGEDYKVEVDYWMPFDGGIGLHDASWRGSFGGTIYKRNGSHGCVNLPHWLAETIYLNSYTGMSVYVAA